MQQLHSATVWAPAACAAQVLATVPELMRFIRTHMRRHRDPALTVPQFRTLIFVRYFPAGTLSQLAEHLGLSTPAASRLVALLVRRGLLDRTQRADNRRCVSLALTPAGRAAFEAAQRSTRAALAQRLAGLAPRDRAQLGQALRTLTAVFADSAPDAAPHGRPSRKGVR